MLLCSATLDPSPLVTEPQRVIQSSRVFGIRTSAVYNKVASDLVSEAGAGWAGVTLSLRVTFVLRTFLP